MACRLFCDDDTDKHDLTHDFLVAEAADCTALALHALPEAAMPLAISISSSDCIDECIKCALVGMLTSGALALQPFGTAFVWKNRRNSIAYVALLHCRVSPHRAGVAALAAQRAVGNSAIIKAWNCGDFVLALPGTVEVELCPKCTTSVPRKACAVCNKKGYRFLQNTFESTVHKINVSLPDASTPIKVFDDTVFTVESTSLQDAAFKELTISGEECKDMQPVQGLPTEPFPLVDLAPLKQWTSRSRTSSCFHKQWVDVYDSRIQRCVERALDTAHRAMLHCMLAGLRQKDTTYGGIVATRGTTCVNSADCRGGLVCFTLHEGPTATFHCLTCQGFSSKAAQRVCVPRAKYLLTLWDDPTFHLACTRLRRGMTREDLRMYVECLVRLKQAVGLLG